MARTPQHPRRWDQAIVIGSGIAGLVAARVLAEHFSRVLLLERDHIADGDLPRAGVPQGPHTHILLARGRMILDALFPGLSDELRAAGAPQVDITRDAAVFGPFGWAVPCSSTLTSVACTRALIELRLRARVLAYPGVQLRDRSDVIGVLAGDTRTVHGVRLRERGTAEQELVGEEAIPADLVVDASGRTSRAPHWLTALGYGAPAETIINSFVGYASVTVAPAAGFQAPWKGVYVMAAPPARLRAGAIWPVEGGRWVVTLAGMSRDYPPLDETGFLTFARSLPTPVLYDALHAARLLTPIVGYRATENRWRHYERLAAWPDGLVVLGDAACSFNPVYGQGMTIAAMSAQVLDCCLQAQRRRRTDGALTGLGRDVQRRLARSNATAWQLATGPDKRAPMTTGGRPTWADRLLYRYLDRVFLHSTVNSNMTRTLLEVLHLSKPPSALFDPRIVRSLLRGMPKRDPESIATHII